MENPSGKNLISHLKDNWFLYAFIAQAIITWTTYGSRITAAEASISELRESDKRDKIVLAEINSRLASIDTSLSFLTGEHYTQVRKTKTQ